MFLKDLGIGLRTLAIDPNNQTVEAYANINCTILGVQWHPERKGNSILAQQWFESVVQNMLKQG